MAKYCLLCGKKLTERDLKNPYIDEVNFCLNCRVRKINERLEVNLFEKHLNDARSKKARGKHVKMKGRRGQSLMPSGF